MKKTTIKTLLLGLSLMAGTAWAQQAQVVYWGAPQTNGNNTTQDATFGTIAVTDAGGGNVTLTAVPYPGVNFSGWYLNPTSTNNADRASSSANFTTPDSPTTYYARFQKSQYNSNGVEWGTYSCNVKTTSIQSGRVIPYIVTAIHENYVDITEITLQGGSCIYYVASNEGVLFQKGKDSNGNVTYNSNMSYDNPITNRHNLAYYGNILVGTGSNTFTVPDDGNKYFAINTAGTAFEKLAVGATVPTNKAYLVDNNNVTTSNELAIGKPEGGDPDPGTDPGTDPNTLLVKVAYWQGSNPDAVQNETLGTFSATLNSNGKVTLTANRIKVNDIEVTRFAGWCNTPNAPDNQIIADLKGGDNKETYTFEVNNEDRTYYAKFARRGFGSNASIDATNPQAYASYSAPVRTTWSDSWVHTYIVEESGITNGEVTLTQLSANTNYVEAGEGVICGKEEINNRKFQNAPGYDKSGKTSFMNNGNLLIGTSASKFTVPNDDYNYYALAIINGVLGFYVIDPGVVIPEMKAYLKLPKSSAGSRTALFIADQDGTTTAIKDIENDAKSKVFYNTAGQKVSPYYRGIVIKNGKKCFTK